MSDMAIYEQSRIGGSKAAQETAAQRCLAIGFERALNFLRGTYEIPRG